MCNRNAKSRLIAGLRHDGLSAPWMIPGAMDRVALNISVETQFAATLQPGDVVILDNLSVPKSAKAEAAVRRVAHGRCSCRNTRPT